MVTGRIFCVLLAGTTEKICARKLLGAAVSNLNNYGQVVDRTLECQCRTFKSTIAANSQAQSASTLAVQEGALCARTLLAGKRIKE